MALEDTANVLRSAEYDPAGTALMQTNPVQNQFEVISDPRLDDDSATGWYMMAVNPAVFDTIELAFLDGQQIPYLESKDGWDVDGVEYKVRHTFAAVALDYRGLYFNYGA